MWEWLQPRFGLWEGFSAPAGAGLGLAGRTGKREAGGREDLLLCDDLLPIRSRAIGPWRIIFLVGLSLWEGLPEGCPDAVCEGLSAPACAVLRSTSRDRKGAGPKSGRTGPHPPI